MARRLGYARREAGARLPRVTITEGAAGGLQRCRDFLRRDDEASAGRAAQAIATRFRLLETRPEIGRPVPGQTGMRELTIPFGRAGYVALYRFDAAADTVHILAFRHAREAGY